MTTPVVRAAPDVTFERIAPAGFRLLAAIDNLSRILSLDVLITCGTNDHPEGDPHTTGEAYDVRVRDWTVPQVLKAITFLRQILGERFTVLYEVPQEPTDPQLKAIAFVNAGASAAHLHLQRKRGTTFPPPAAGLERRPDDSAA